MPQPNEIPIGDERRRLMTISQAADCCAVDYDTFLAWVKKGVLPHVHVGPAQSIRVYARDVEALITPAAKPAS